MNGQGFPLIPADIVKAWSKGEYYVGDIPSISYRHLGIALLLRGWYIYADKDRTNRKKWGGLAKVDINGSVLSMVGVRLFDSKLVFWKTEHSYIRDEKEVIWFYSGFDCEVPQEIQEKYLDSKWRLREQEKRFGLKPESWQGLLKRMASDLDGDADRLKGVCGEGNMDHGMLRFNVHLYEGRNLDREIRKIWRAHKPSGEPIRFRICQYAHFDSGSQTASTGTAYFTKVNMDGLI